MRPEILFTAVLLAVPASAFAQSSGSWEFIGIGVEEKVGCVNNPATRYGYTWVTKDGNPNFSAERLQVRDSLKREYGMVQLTPLTVRADRPQTIAVVKKFISCGQWSGPRKMVTSYAFVTGPDSLAIVRRLENDVQTSTLKDLKGFEVLEWIRLEVRDMIRPPGSTTRPAKMTAIGVRG